MNAYKFSDAPHARRHGPQGYDDYGSYKPWLRDDFTFRCVYCLNREKWDPSAEASFGIDHVTAQATDASLALDYDNLVYACNRCNSCKRNTVILNPCQIALSKHVRIKDDGTVEALTEEGADYVKILLLNDPQVISYRHRLINALKSLSLSENHEDQQQVLEWLSFPEDLPDLARLRPKANRRPNGVRQSYHAMRANGKLPEQY